MQAAVLMFSDTHTRTHRNLVTHLLFFHCRIICSQSLTLTNKPVWWAAEHALPCLTGWSLGEMCDVEEPKSQIFLEVCRTSRSPETIVLCQKWGLLITDTTRLKRTDLNVCSWTVCHIGGLLLLLCVFNASIRWMNHSRDESTVSVPLWHRASLSHTVCQHGRHERAFHQTNNQE